MEKNDQIRTTLVAMTLGMSSIDWTGDNDYLRSLFLHVYKFKAHLVSPDTHRRYKEVWDTVRRSLNLSPLYKAIFVEVEMCQIIYNRYINLYKDAYLQGHTLTLSPLEIIAKKILIEACSGIEEGRQAAIASSAKIFPLGEKVELKRTKHVPKKPTRIRESIPWDSPDPLIPVPVQPSSSVPDLTPGTRKTERPSEGVIFIDESPPPSPKRSAQSCPTQTLAQLRFEFERVTSLNRRMDLIESLLQGTFDVIRQ